MLHKLKQRNSEGFTIIEVMIVLAIAGLIMVVVFMAVPALQRSGRNNALDSSANSLLSAVGEYVSNNNGTLPADVSATAPSNNQTSIGSTGNTTKASVDSGTKTVAIASGTTAAITNSADVGTFQVFKGKKCDATGTGLSSDAVSSRSYVVLYVAETAGGKIVKCVGS